MKSKASFFPKHSSVTLLILLVGCQNGVLYENADGLYFDLDSSNEPSEVIDEQQEIYFSEEDLIFLQALDEEQARLQEAGFHEPTLDFSDLDVDPDALINAVFGEGSLQDSSDDDRTPQYNGESQPAFLLWGHGELQKRVERGCIRIRLKGHSRYNRRYWMRITQNAIFAWAHPLRERFGHIRQICTIFTDSNSHLTLNIKRGRPGQRAYYRSRYRILGKTIVSPLIVMYEGSESVADEPRVLVHEFGHAFGLGDTYIEGGRGACKPGQPVSRMCRSRLSEHLSHDDIRGVRNSFCRSSRSCNAANYSDFIGYGHGRYKVDDTFRTNSKYAKGIYATVRSGILRSAIAVFDDDSIGTSIGLWDISDDLIAWNCPDHSYISGVTIAMGSRQGFVRGMKFHCSRFGRSARYVTSSPWMGQPAQQVRVRYDCPSPFYFPYDDPFVKGFRGTSYYRGDEARTGGIGKFALICGGRREYISNRGYRAWSDWEE